MLKDRLRDELRATVTVAQEEPVEVLLSAGDMAVIDPMCMHAASPCRLPGHSRYVCINSWFDASAAGHVCHPVRGATEPAEKFPRELRWAPFLPPPAISCCRYDWDSLILGACFRHDRYDGRAGVCSDGLTAAGLPVELLDWETPHVPDSQARLLQRHRANALKRDTRSARFRALARY